MCYSLPKCWQGRIQKYWDKIMPTGFPVSDSKFDIKFKDEDDANAVATMEAQLGTDESVVLTMIPEDTVVSTFVGVYDVTSEANTLTLLCPNKVNSDNVVVMHYTDGNWSKVEDFQIIDGYVWGTLTSFSPIAVFEYIKDIHTATVEGISQTIVACEGRPVQVKINDNNNTVVVNPATGKEVEVPAGTSVIVVGGSVDGTDVDSTSVTVIGVENKSMNVFAGSLFSNKTDTTSAHVKNAVVNVIDSSINIITGSYGAVRTENVEINIKNSVLKTAVACGQCYMTEHRTDANKANPTFASRAWVKNAKINIEDSSSYMIFGGGNSGYLYVDNTEVNIKGLTSASYVTLGGSNGYTKNAVMNVEKSALAMIQYVNRGGFGNGELTVVDSTVEKGISLGGDNSEGDVDGTVESVKLDVNAGDSEFAILLGVNGKDEITADAVSAVKVSRNAGNITVDEHVIAVLRNKYVIK